MGLDMYLFARKKTKENVLPPTETELNEFIEVGYWRKANQIHRWFSELAEEKKGHQLENCEYIIIDRDDLVRLEERCKLVLENVKNIEVVDAILPTLAGFFYGGIDYDEWYYDEVKDTLEQIAEILHTFDFENEELLYWAWW